MKRKCLKCHKELDNKDIEDGYRLCPTCRQENARIDIEYMSIHHNSYLVKRLGLITFKVTPW